LLSLVSNIGLMKVFTGWLGMPVLPANLAAITLTSFLNFLVGDWWVFRRANATPPEPPPAYSARTP
jgi:putative flippase GtrA